MLAVQPDLAELERVDLAFFCGPSGTCFMVRVAVWAKRMSATATIHVTTIELVIGKPNGRAISTAFCDRPCSML